MFRRIIDLIRGEAKGKLDRMSISFGSLLFESIFIYY